MISRKLLRGALICLILVQCLGPSEAQAWDDLIPGSRYTSARSAALGGADLPLGDDGAAALFENPADIGKFRNFQVEGANVAFTANGGFTDNLGLDSYKTYSLSSNLPQLEASPGSFRALLGRSPRLFSARALLSVS